jgi:hypothetical protein
MTLHTLYNGIREPGDAMVRGGSGLSILYMPIQKACAAKKKLFKARKGLLELGLREVEAR